MQGSEWIYTPLLRSSNKGHGCKGTSYNYVAKNYLLLTFISSNSARKAAHPVSYYVRKSLALFYAKRVLSVD